MLFGFSLLMYSGRFLVLLWHPTTVSACRGVFTSCVPPPLLLKAVRDARGPAGPRSAVHSSSSLPRTFTLRRSVRLLGPESGHLSGVAGVFVYSSTVHLAILSVKVFSVAMFSDFLVLEGKDTFYGFSRGSRVVISWALKDLSGDPSKYPATMCSDEKGNPGLLRGKGRLCQISEFAVSHRPLSGLRGGHPLRKQPDERVVHVVLVPCAISRGGRLVDLHGRIRGALRWRVLFGWKPSESHGRSSEGTRLANVSKET